LTGTGTETILVVEDQAALRHLICESLAKRGYAVLQAESPAAALELARRKRDTIHVLLTDVIMPGMEGPALAEQILTRNRQSSEDG
jgi:CheY-like chemotaxis protein